MGKKEKKKQKQPHRRHYGGVAEELEEIPSCAYDLPKRYEEEEDESEDQSHGEEEEEEEEESQHSEEDFPSKFLLYQKSVQAPKGDISYLQKFFLMYIGGRFPLHLQEDFCGTALLCTEWLCSDPRRTAVGVDVDLEALQWCLENNANKIGSDGYSRMFLFHGDVLQPSEASLVTYKLQESIKNITLDSHQGSFGTVEQAIDSKSTLQVDPNDTVDKEAAKKSFNLPARDIVCAFNYSCCCLKKRTDLVLYFRNALNALSRRGGIFVMDLYGGKSSEHELKLRRRFSNFTYVWEQEGFDIINRTTRISLHFHLGKNRGMLRHAFSYSWRLWSLPEIKDCLLEAGFRSVHFWIREMPDTQESQNTQEFGVSQDVKYEEVSSFEQQDAWNSYVVAVANH